MAQQAGFGMGKKKWRLFMCFRPSRLANTDSRLRVGKCAVSCCGQTHEIPLDTNYPSSPQASTDGGSNNDCAQPDSVE